MAVDSKLEKFALDIFHYVGKRTQLSDELLEKWNDNECRREDPLMENVCKLIICRLDLFRNKFIELENDVELLKSNDVNFVHYIRENMSKYFPYPCMNIYDKIFMSVAVVLELSELLHRKKKHMSCAPHIWSMYFEKEFKEEFYAEEDCWEKLEIYAKDSNTCAIQNWTFSFKSIIMFDTDLKLAENVFSDFRETYSCRNIMKLFKNRLNHPLCSFCCLKCLPLFDVLYFLSFNEKLVSDFQLVEGYIQLFLKTWSSDKFETMCQENLRHAHVSVQFKTRVFPNKDFKDSVQEHGGNICIFCKGKREKDVVSLKSLLCRTVSREAIADQEEKREA